jgi:NADP-dependent aldehyde dehydrogenase
MDRAAARPDPIPVYAEMGSLNPVVVTDGALAARADAIVAALTRSVCDFGGQLCTKPGLVLVPEGERGDAFAAALAGAVAERAPEVLLNEAVLAGLRAGLQPLDAAPAVTRLTPAGDDGDAGFHGHPVAYRAAAADLGRVAPLAEEHFGPVVVVLTYTSLDDAAAALERAGGQLAATVHAEPGEHAALAPLAAACARVAGRIVFDGVPTGVAVTWGMQHGGPWPASSAPSTTSVGMTALRRFLRPVAYQDAPQALLPAALRDGNPLSIVRRIDGNLTGE